MVVQADFARQPAIRSHRVAQSPSSSVGEEPRARFRRLPAEMAATPSLTRLRLLAEVVAIRQQEMALRAAPEAAVVLKSQARPEVPAIPQQPPRRKVITAAADAASGAQAIFMAVAVVVVRAPWAPRRIALMGAQVGTGHRPQSLAHRLRMRAAEVEAHMRQLVLLVQAVLAAVVLAAMERWGLRAPRTPAAEAGAVHKHREAQTKPAALAARVLSSSNTLPQLPSNPTSCG